MGRNGTLILRLSVLTDTVHHGWTDWWLKLYLINRNSYIVEIITDGLSSLPLYQQILKGSMKLVFIFEDYYVFQNWWRDVTWRRDVTNNGLWCCSLLNPSLDFIRIHKKHAIGEFQRDSALYSTLRRSTHTKAGQSWFGQESVMADYSSLFGSETAWLH